jgi:hypothetical protein
MVIQVNDFYLPLILMNALAVVNIDEKEGTELANLHDTNSTFTYHSESYSYDEW